MSKNDSTDDENKVEGTIRFLPRNPGKSVTGKFGMDAFIARELGEMQKHLEDHFVAETIDKLSAILKDPKHPAHHKVRRLVLEAKNATTST